MRVDPAASKHEGIGFLLINLASPGIRVAPIRLINGGSQFCEVFFEDVRVPAENLVGEPNQGWSIAKKLLEYERKSWKASVTAIANVSASPCAISRANGSAMRTGASRTRSCATTSLPMRSMMPPSSSRAGVCAEETAANGQPGPVSAMMELLAAELNKRRLELAVAAAGSYAFGWEGEGEGFSALELRLTRDWLRSKANSIEGGSADQPEHHRQACALAFPIEERRMTLVLTPEAEIIRDTARQFFDKRSPVSALRALRDRRDPDDLRGPCGTTWPSSAGPALWFRRRTAARSSASRPVLALALEAAGRTLAPTPLFSTALLRASALVLGGSDEQKREFLRGLVSRAAACLAVALEDAAHHAPQPMTTRAERTANGWRLNGTKPQHSSWMAALLTYSSSLRASMRGMKAMRSDCSSCLGSQPV